METERSDEELRVAEVEEILLDAESVEELAELRLEVEEEDGL